MIRRFLTSDDINFAKSGKGNSCLKTCPCCGKKSKKRAFSPDPGDWPLGGTASVASNQRAPYNKEYPDYRHPQVNTAGIDPSSFNLWVSWQQRRKRLKHSKMDPILVRLARSSRADLRQVTDPETWSSNFPRDVRQNILAAVAPAIARTGNVRAARRLITSGFNVDMVDEDGMSPLLWAAVQGHEEMVQLLLENKAEIEKHDQAFKRTPLSLAALGGHKAVVDLLLNAGANVHSSDSSRRTSLFWAVVGGHISVVQSLVAFGARYQDPDRIFFMPYSRDEESADGKYSSRTVFRPMSLIDSAKMQCFTSAIEKGDEKAVCELLDQDHDIHRFNVDSKKTILDLALESGNWAIIQILFQHDAERVQRGSVTMVSRLLKVYKGNDGASSVVG